MRTECTIGAPVTFAGKAVHGGTDVHMTVKPAGDAHGVVFVRTDLEGNPRIPAVAGSLRERPGTGCTILEKDDVRIATVEHLLAACHALDIDNALVEISGPELPILDGSAAPFYDALKQTGIREQKNPKTIIVLDEPLWCGTKDAVLTAVPCDSFAVSYIYRHPECGGGHTLVFPDGAAKRELFEKHLARARTFCREEDIEEARARGLGKGADSTNTLVIRTKKSRDDYRIPDEPVYHKMVDLLGDLFLAGAEIRAHIIGAGSGHALNARLVAQLCGKARRSAPLQS